MKAHRQLTLAFVPAILVVIAAGAAITLGGCGSAGPATTSAAAGNGPFLTAAALPQGLADRPVPLFALTDARGGSFSSARLRGRPYALTFLYVHCVDVCPLIGSEIHDALAKLGPHASGMNVVAISVDPRGDTRPAVKRGSPSTTSPRTSNT